MKLATWNINSIRARNDRLLAWLDRDHPDVLCLQETKVEDSAFPFEVLRKAGYEVATFGQRSYNGVAIASTQPLADVTRAFGDGADDDDARLIAASTHGVRVVCVYVVNGQELTSERYPYKLAWLRRLRAYLDRTATPEIPLVVCGDMNVAPDDRDVWSPEKWKDQIHCSTPEREALAEVVGFGLTDLFRLHHGDTKLYSWWDYRGVAFFKDQGLRIDHIFATKPLADRCTTCTIDRTARKGQDASDHAPVIATFAD
ncbi:MAG: exodeoxyribonuclease III [Deltaproteobacteria bacterium]|nr:exodeoxyribonuclease III [Deltaproteobacteria bacterium]MDQ3300694.1 exodeoxyribonuclease III [Myxococcota bacterium]